jgi:two-component system, chemotaxis family, protein-glutamate methylesterase/glutaminase
MSPRRTNRSIDVLVVDDSAVTRQVLTELLSRTPGFTVRTASDPLLAFEKMKQRRPDVMVLDLELPRMGGLDFLRMVMADDPLPVVICSAFAPRGTEQALLALEEGAINIFPKAQSGLKQFFEDTAGNLIEVLRDAAEARVVRRTPELAMAREERKTASALLPPPVLMSTSVRSGALIVIGASAGGTEAIKVVLQSLPADAPPMGIVLHMRPEFVSPFAARLDGACPQRVRVAQHGERLERGTALFAPGGRHLVVVRRGDEYFADVVDGPPVARHRPSVDVLFRSAATAAGKNAVAILLTGMGDDGAAGMLELRSMGAHTIAQDEATCVVFGMPKEAIQRGGAQVVAPLGRIGALAIDAAKSGVRRA